MVLLVDNSAYLKMLSFRSYFTKKYSLPTKKLLFFQAHVVRGPLSLAALLRPAVGPVPHGRVSVRGDEGSQV